ncbi:MAG: hypothetical protein RR614_06585 [Eubacterium sp.]
MLEKNSNIEAVVQEYPEEYHDLIRNCLTVTEKEFETFIISLIM